MRRIPVRRLSSASESDNGPVEVLRSKGGSDKGGRSKSRSRSHSCSRSRSPSPNLDQSCSRDRADKDKNSGDNDVGLSNESAVGQDLGVSAAVDVNLGPAVVVDKASPLSSALVIPSGPAPPSRDPTSEVSSALCPPASKKPKLFDDGDLEDISDDELLDYE